MKLRQSGDFNKFIAYWWIQLETQPIMHQVWSLNGMNRCLVLGENHYNMAAERSAIIH